MRFFNTLSRSLEEFHEIEKGKIGLYTCGPTVYDYPHIGNYRSYVFEDLVKRFFLFLGFQVQPRDEHHRHRRQDHPQGQRNRGAAGRR